MFINLTIKFNAMKKEKEVPIEELIRRFEKAHIEYIESLKELTPGGLPPEEESLLKKWIDIFSKLARGKELTNDEANFVIDKISKSEEDSKE
ncbi:MAG: hypothetical protein A2Y71_03040 [Bacteroidetes bacterium RBG_13_42_15]|nr:MAG: hypothetical protein A2Y71_03040 [Bacteroidetes bacterium RBG_13_42_15]